MKASQAGKWAFWLAWVGLSAVYHAGFARGFYAGGKQAHAQSQADHKPAHARSQADQCRAFNQANAGR